MDVIFIAGMIDRKLESKILPLQNLEKIERIFLIRKKRFLGKKIINFNTPKRLINNYIFSELLRIIQTIWVILRYNPKYVIGAGLMPHGIYAILLAKIFFRKSVLLLMGEMEFPLTHPPATIKQKILTAIVKNASIIGVRGSKSEKRIKALVYSKPVFIANNVFSFDEFRPLNLQKKYDLIFIGNIQQEKRLDILLDILVKIKRDKYIEPKTIIIGEGKLKKDFIRFIKEKGLNNVKFLPFKEKKELNKYLNESKIFVLTSQFEGLPMVLVETIACGVPPISFDIADISDLVTNDYNGYLIKYGDTNDFMNKLYLLISDSGIYNRIRSNCLKTREKFEKTFSIDYNTKIWNKLL